MKKNELIASSILTQKDHCLLNNKYDTKENWENQLVAVLPSMNSFKEEQQSLGKMIRILLLSDLCQVNDLFYIVLIEYKKINKDGL